MKWPPININAVTLWKIIRHIRKWIRQHKIKPKNKQNEKE